MKVLLEHARQVAEKDMMKECPEGWRMPSPEADGKASGEGWAVFVEAQRLILTPHQLRRGLPFIRLRGTSGESRLVRSARE